MGYSITGRFESSLLYSIALSRAGSLVHIFYRGRRILALLSLLVAWGRMEDIGGRSFYAADTVGGLFECFKRGLFVGFFVNCTSCIKPRIIDYC